MDRRGFLRSAATSSVVGGTIVTGCLDRVWSPESAGDNPYGIDENDADTEWRLTFSDEFDQGELDSSAWTVGYGWGREHFGWEYVRDEDVWLDDENDLLVLQLDYDESYGPVEDESEPYHWYGGGVNTKGNFSQRQGYWEARLRLPKPVEGVTPAFWAKPATEEFPPELDIMEHFSVADETWSAIHWGDTELGGKRNVGDELETDYGSYDHDDDPRENFVVYGAHWQDDRTDFYVDGERYHTVTDGHGDDPNLREMNYSEPFYMMLSTQFSDSWGDPTQYDDYPYEWYVDWVNVWEEDE